LLFISQKKKKNSAGKISCEGKLKMPEEAFSFFGSQDFKLVKEDKKRRIERQFGW